MANIRETDSLAQTGQGIPDEAVGPGEDGQFEAQIERVEKRLKAEHDANHYLGEHPDGIGPTLGQDLGRPNPGHDVDWNGEDYDPPT
jgi:hypothetical protein